MLNVRRRRLRLALLLLLLTCSLAVLCIVNSRTQASAALKRVRMGMSMNDVNAVMPEAGCSKGYSYHVNSIHVQGQIFSFADNSELQVNYADGRVDGVQVCEPDWQKEAKFWLLDKIGINLF